jgi:hypothetical protein
MSMSLIIGGIILVIIIILGSVGAYYVSKHNKKIKDLEVTTAQIPGSNTIDGSTIVNGTISGNKIEPDYFLNSNYRYFIDSFYRLPQLAGAYISSESTASSLAAITSYYNLDFFLLGLTGADNALATITSNGLKLMTGSTSTYAMGVISRMPIANTLTAFKYQTSFSLPQITETVLKIGLVLSDKSSSTGPDDDNQAFLLYDTNNAYGYTDSGSTTLTNSSFLFIYSIAGLDYITKLPIPPNTSQVYVMTIKNSSGGKLSLFINGIQYSLNSTFAGTFSNNPAQISVSGGTGASNTYSTLVSFKSTCKITTLTTSSASKTVYLNYVKSSQLITY